MKYLVMLYNYPFAFVKFKKDIKSFNLDSEERQNLEFIEIKDGEIDKDLLLKGNKIYSPENCCLIPREINGSLNNKRKSNSHLPIGVSNNGSGKYTSKRNFGGLQKHLGTFKTIEEAFFAYKTEKESYIKELAYKWKNQIDPRAYNALMSWEVNIDD